MSLLSDAKTLYHIVLSPVRGDSHQERLESFYSGQAEAYDDFRKRLLHGREDLCNLLPIPEGGVWMDMGGGTGSNLEAVGERINAARKVYVVDLATSLLAMARKRAEARGWHHVQAVEADATTFVPEEGTVDLITFSYSLTMIPDWFRALEHALTLLKPGGHIGVVDFYVSRKYPAEGRAKHGMGTRVFWPTWFMNDNVYLSSEHLPFLESHFDTVHIEERRAPVPYIPGIKVPIYLYLGKKK
jgi:S-adenosylmethionine-diacylgycerolhomoserine-N-methlytransferase